MFGCEAVVGDVDPAPEQGREPRGYGQIFCRATLDIAAAEEIEEGLILARFGWQDTLDANASNLLVSNLKVEGLPQRIAHGCISRVTLLAPLGYACRRYIEAFRQRRSVDKIPGLAADGRGCGVAATDHDEHIPKSWRMMIAAAHTGLKASVETWHWRNASASFG